MLLVWSYLLSTHGGTSRLGADELLQAVQNTRPLCPSAANQSALDLLSQQCRELSHVTAARRQGRPQRIGVMLVGESFRDSGGSKARFRLLSPTCTPVTLSQQALVAHQHLSFLDKLSLAPLDCCEWYV